MAATGQDAYASGEAQVQEEVTGPGPPLPQPHRPPSPAPPPPNPGIDLGAGSSQPAIARDPASGDTYVAWVAEGGKAIDVCTVLPGGGSCNGGAGPHVLTDAKAGGGAQYYPAPRVVVEAGGTVVVIDELYGVLKAASPAGYEKEGVAAWSSPAGGAAFAVDNEGILLASSYHAGDMPQNGATTLGAGRIATYGDDTNESGFMDFTLAASAPAPTPTVDHTTKYDAYVLTTGSQLAAIPNPEEAGAFIVVVVGADGKAACTSEDSTGYGVAVGTPAQLQEQKAWGAAYFKAVACNAFAPVLSSGASGIGLLEDEGAGLGGSGEDGLYYRRFATATKTFEAPVELSNETHTSYGGADDVSAAQDAAGGVYAGWADQRGVIVDYSNTGGTSWGAPVATGIRGADAVVAGAGGGTAEVAYTYTPSGGSSQVYLDPSA